MTSKLTFELAGEFSPRFAAWFAEVNEGLGEAYRIGLSASSEDVMNLAALRSLALGRRAIVRIEQFFRDGTVVRTLNGLVTEVRHEGSVSLRPEWLAAFGSDRPKGALYAFVIEPSLVQLKWARRTQDYPDTTPLKAIQDVLARHNIVPILEGAYVAQEKYTGTVRFVQHDETDWDFLHRLLARYGLSYAFAHTAQGPERLYLSDGFAYPPASPLSFANLEGYADGETLRFSCVRQMPGSFPMKAFAAASGLGVDYVQNRFLRPANSTTLEKTWGSRDTARAWWLSAAPAGYGEQADDASVERDFQRAMEATQARLALVRNRWHGETASVAAMPGKVLALEGFLDASGGRDETVKVKVVRTRLTVRLGDNDMDTNFAVQLEAMDFSDDAPKRWVPPAPPASAPRAPYLEAVVCDRGGRWNEASTRNTIVVSPHSTPETPWVFLVANPSGGEGAVMDVAMTLPLGGRRQGLYRFPRVGDRVLVADLGDRLVLAGYVPDKSGSFGDFPEGGDAWTRRATSLRFGAPTGEKTLNGSYGEVGFSHALTPAEQMAQRIVDGSATAYLLELALDDNNIETYNAVVDTIGPALERLRQSYFAQPGKDSAGRVAQYAGQIASAFNLDRRAGTCGDCLRLHSDGTMVQYAKDGLELATPGTLRITARDVVINGLSAVQLTSEGRVQTSVGATSVTANPCGAVVRSRRVLDAPGDYDSELSVGAVDGVSATGANVRLNGLFSASMTDAMGGAVAATNGELRGSGAVVDFATATRKATTEAFEKLPEASGLNKVDEVLSAWKAGSTPDGQPRAIYDPGTGPIALSGTSTKAGFVPVGNFRGTVSGLTIASENLSDTQGRSGSTAALDNAAFRRVPGGKEGLTVSQRELLRAEAFAQQVQAHAKTVRSVLNTVVEGRSSSVTIHGHSLDLNVQNLSDLSEHKNSDGGMGAGA